MAFQTALSGLNSAQKDLDVIGNNIANASTSGFKQSRAEFSDVYAASLAGSGSNAVGGGSRVSGVTQQFSQGSVEFTENGLDMAINGDGFFRLNDNGSTVYSRAGNFGVDRDGYIVNQDGLNLTGYLANSSGQMTGALGDLQIGTSSFAPQATSLVDVEVNLDDGESVPAVAPFDLTDPATYNNVTSTTVYDSLGNSYIQDYYFVKTAVPNEWDVYVAIDGVGQTIDDGVNPPSSTMTVDFDQNGQIVGDTDFTVVGWQPVTDQNGVPIEQQIDISLAGSTQYGSDFNVLDIAPDGYATGELSGVDVDEAGVIFARYTNGQSRALGQVALAQFNNTQGLKPLGDNLWTGTYASGAEIVGAPDSGGLGAIQSGALEGSNVDVSKELVDMITAQRNYQANAKMITTEDEMTQTIMNIR